MLTTAVLAEHSPRASDGAAIHDVARRVGFYGKDWYRKLLIDDGSKHPRFLSAANRVICDPADFEALKAALIDPDCSQALLESHAIDDEAHAFLVNDDKLEFVEARFRRIVALENEWLERHGSDLRIELPESVSIET